MPEKPRRFLLISAVSLLMLLLPGEASATHYRYGNITWRKLSGTTNQVEFTITTAWRIGYPWPGGLTPAVGTNMNTGTPFYFGDGTSTTLMCKITSINSTEGWFFGEMKVNKTYASNGNYTAYFSGCCRISSLSWGADGSFRSETTVNIGTTNNSPTSTMPPMINLQTGQSAAAFNVPGADPDNNTLTWRLATSSEVGITPVSGLSVNSSTGACTFNTVGKSVGSQYAATIAITDGTSKTLVDFIINIVQTSNPPAFDYTVTPANNFQYQVSPGQTVAFSVKATDPDAGATVALSAVGLPSGATFNTGSPANPKTVAFSWTPTSSQLGLRIITFTAQDNNGVQRQTSVAILVSMKPVFDVPPTPANNSLIVKQPGDTLSFTVRASDPDNTDSVQIVSIQGRNNIGAIVAISNSLYSGVSFSTPTAKGNPTSGGFSWIPGVASWGPRPLIFTARDKYNDQTTHEIPVLINTTPKFTSTPVLTVYAGQAYNYSITSSDPDTAYGDELELHGISLPSWLTLTDNGDGTGTLSGTPGIAEIGTYNFSIHLEDIYHHDNIGGIPHQDITLQVLPCQISASADVTDALCNGDNNGSIDLTVSNNVGSTSFAWSNSASSEDLSNIGAGTYSVIVTDNAGCKDTVDNIVVSEPDVLQASASVSSNYNGSDVSCNGSSDGSIDLSVSGGTPAYGYAWSNSASSEDLSNIGAGNYSVTVTDANGCSAIADATISEPSAVSASAAVSSNYNGEDVSCYGSGDGSIDLTASGGTGTLSFAWSNSATSEDLSNIAAGGYSVTVSDANGCEATAGATLTNPAELTANAGSDQTTYYGYTPMASATLTGSSSGGTGSVSYEWSTSATTASITVTPSATTNYTFTVTDANNCEANDAVTVTVYDVRCGKKNDKVAVCHKTGSTSNPTTDICIDENAVATHLKNHGDQLGACNMRRSGNSYIEFGNEMVLNISNNPINEGTVVSFFIPRDGAASLAVYTMDGRLLNTLFSGNAITGDLYEFALDSRVLPGNGIYLIRLASGNEVKTIKSVKTQ